MKSRVASSLSLLSLTVLALVLGNCLASAVIARWEGEFDEARAEAEFGDGAGGGHGLSGAGP